MLFKQYEHTRDKLIEIVKDNEDKLNEEKVLILAQLFVCMEAFIEGYLRFLKGEIKSINYVPADVPYHWIPEWKKPFRVHLMILRYDIRVRAILFQDAKNFDLKMPMAI